MSKQESYYLTKYYLKNNDRACILNSYFKHLGKDLGTEVCNNDQGNSSVVQVVMISESRRLQATLKTFGIQVGYCSETLVAMDFP